MSENPQPEKQSNEDLRSQQEGQWALPVEHLHSKDVKADMNVNVEGKQLAGPLRGFGQMWQKTYRIRFGGAEVTPQEIVQAWKDNFGRFWPRDNRFFSAGESIGAGDVAVLNLAGPYGLRGPGGKGLVSTGVLVIYTDEESFSFMTPEGHIFGGMITFSADELDGGVAAQIQALVRANDPLYELGARVGVVHSMEDDHWKTVLENLAAHFGAQGQVMQENKLIDPGLQWNQAGNIRHNAAIHTGIYLALTPLRWVAGLFRRKPETE